MPRSQNSAATMKDGSSLIAGDKDAAVFSNLPAITSVQRFGRCN
ncbi:hypothetical protein [Sorangium sp. So ce388]